MNLKMKVLKVNSNHRQRKLHKSSNTICDQFSVLTRIKVVPTASQANNKKEKMSFSMSRHRISITKDLRSNICMRLKMGLFLKDGMKKNLYPKIYDKVLLWSQPNQIY